MSDSYRYKLTSKNFIFLLICTMQEVTFLQLTRRTAEHSGHDAWISIFLTSLLAFASLYIINTLCGRFPNMTLAEFNNEICGPYLGRLLSFIYIAYALAYSSLVIKTFVDLINSYLLVRTPVWVLSLVMVLTVAYIFSRDIRAIAWMNESTTFLLQILWVIILFGLTKAKLQNLLPVGDAGIQNIALGMNGAFFAYLGPEILLVIYPFIQNKKEVLRAGALAVAYVALSYTIIALVVLGVFGGTAVKLFVWDVLAMIKSYELPVVERSEFFIAMLWSWLAIRSSSNQLFMARHTLAKAAGIKERYHWYLVGTLAAAAFALSLIPQSAAQTFIATYYVSYVGISIMLGLPLFLLLLSLARGVKAV